MPPKSINLTVMTYGVSKISVSRVFKKMNTSVLSVGMLFGSTIMENNVVFLQRINIRTAYAPGVLLLGIHTHGK